MRTGLKKQQKVTEIFYNAKDPKAEMLWTSGSEPIQCDSPVVCRPSPAGR